MGATKLFGGATCEFGQYVGFGMDFSPSKQPVDMTGATKINFSPKEVERIQWKISMDAATNPLKGVVLIDSVAVHGYRIVRPYACMTCVKPSTPPTGAMFSNFEGTVPDENKAGQFWYAYNAAEGRAVTSQAEYSEIFGGVTSPEPPLTTLTHTIAGKEGNGGGEAAWIDFTLGPTYPQNGHTINAFAVPIGNDLWNRVRIPLSSFVQPAWRATATGLNSGSVTALRFSYTGEGTIRFDLDNVHIEELKVGPAPVVSPQAFLREPMVQGLRVGREGLAYGFQPGTGRGLWTAEVLDMSGRVLGRRRLVWLGGTLQAGFPGLTLGSGGYFLRHRSADRLIAGPFVIP